MGQMQPPKAASPAPSPAAKETAGGKLVAQAKKLSDEKKHSEALVLYQRAIALEPGNASIYNSMGLCYFDMGKTDAAIDAFKKAVERDPGMSGAYQNLGRCHASQKQWDLAIIEYRKAIKDNPKNGLAYFDLANVYFVKKDLKKAKECYEEAAKIFGYDTGPGEESLRNALKVEMLMQRMGK
jgi:tetratricopeptide (TPR) repeat protein